MQIIETHNSNIPTINSYQAGKIVVDNQSYHHPILLHHTVEQLAEKWQPEQLSLSDFQAAIDANAEIIIIGTGSKQRFISSKLVAELSQYGLGLECMHTAAACRTIILLQSEERRVWAWLLV